MTKKDFTYALKSGLGRCILAARENPAKYRDVIFRACQKCPAFDPQSEGTRAWYMYEVISCYEDKAFFLQVICEKFLKQKSTGGWNIQYFSELLCYFADDGFAEAKEALWEKYDRLYQGLQNRKRAPQGIFHERDDFEMLCVTLSYDFDSYLRIAKDIGALYLSKSFYNGFDFEWFYSHGEGKKYNRRLKAKAKQSAQLQCYLETQWMREKEVQARLENRAPSVQRAVKNYQPQEVSMLENVVANMKVDYEEESDWHQVHMDILELFRKDKGISNPPKNVLPILYETTLCSCCREEMVFLMGKYRMLSPEVLEECLYDCNEEIRKYAQKRLRRIVSSC